MEGGMTRRRGYLWLTAVLLVVLLIVVFIGRPPTRNNLTSQNIQNTPNTLKNQDTPNCQNNRIIQNNRNTQTCQSHCRTASPSPTQSIPPATIFRKDKTLLFNLNTADSLDLVQLYNIGPAFARRIIRYRTQLGGFVDKQQLWEVYGMDSVRYNDIAPHLYANPEDITRIDLNSVTLDQLKRHPYLDYYQAKAIVQLREASGPFSDIQDLLKIPIIDQETYSHIAPYLSCNSQPNK